MDYTDLIFNHYGLTSINDISKFFKMFINEGSVLTNNSMPSKKQFIVLYDLSGGLINQIIDNIIDEFIYFVPYVLYV